MPNVYSVYSPASMPAFLSLDKDLQVRLMALAEACRLQPEQLVENAVREYVEREEYRNAQAFEDLKKWQRFDASGRKDGISLDEITPWLDSWGTGKDFSPPAKAE